jgi:hypothetical protein
MQHRSFASSLASWPAHCLALGLASVSLAACAAGPGPGASAAGPAPKTASTATAPTGPDDNPVGEYAYSLTRTGDLHDFDFIAGAWTLQNSRLKARLVGSHDWEEFPAVDCGAVYLGGVVNVDELVFPTKGWSGVTFRNYDTEKHQWSIYWVNSRSGKMFPPVLGGFTGDRGEFYGEDEDDGRKVKVRFLWIKHGPDRAHWEQAFTLDGVNWEVNWRNDLTRADPAKICDGVSPRT